MSNRRKDFGQRVRALRERAGFKKPTEFAAAAGIGTRSLASVELGNRAGPKTLRSIARTLGWREDDVLDYIDEKTDDLPDPDLPGAAAGTLGPLEEVLTASVSDLAKLARLYAWYEARRLGRGPIAADEETFMRWAMQVRTGHERGGIKPSVDD